MNKLTQNNFKEKNILFEIGSSSKISTLTFMRQKALEGRRSGWSLNSSCSDKHFRYFSEQILVFSAVNYFCHILPDVDCIPCAHLFCGWVGSCDLFLIAVYMWAFQSSVKEPLQFPLYNHAPQASCPLFVCKMPADFKNQKYTATSVVESFWSTYLSEQRGIQMIDYSICIVSYSWMQAQFFTLESLTVQNFCKICFEVKKKVAWYVK